MRTITKTARTATIVATATLALVPASAAGAATTGLDAGAHGDRVALHDGAGQLASAPAQPQPAPGDEAPMEPEPEPTEKPEAPEPDEPAAEPEHAGEQPAARPQAVAAPQVGDPGRVVPGLGGENGAEAAQQKDDGEGKGDEEGDGCEAAGLRNALAQSLFEAGENLILSDQPGAAAPLLDAAEDLYTDDSDGCLSFEPDDTSDTKGEEAS